jgi:hypothetical protein
VSIKNAHLWYGAVREGTWNHVVLQVTRQMHLAVTLQIVFPNGTHVTRGGRTDTRGHWEATFSVPRGTWTATLNRAVVVIQVHYRGTIKRKSMTFTIVK